MTVGARVRRKSTDRALKPLRLVLNVEFGRRDQHPDFSGVKAPGFTCCSQGSTSARRHLASLPSKTGGGNATAGALMALVVYFCRFCRVMPRKADKIRIGRNEGTLRDRAFDVGDGRRYGLARRGRVAREVERDLAQTPDTDRRVVAPCFEQRIEP